MSKHNETTTQPEDENIVVPNAPLNLDDQDVNQPDPQQPPTDGQEPQAPEGEPQPAAEPQQQVTDFDLSAFLGVPVAEFSPEHRLQLEPQISNEGFAQVRRLSDRSMYVESFMVEVPDGAGGTRREQHMALLEGYKFRTYDAPTTDESKPISEMHRQAQIEAFGYELAIESKTINGRLVRGYATDEQGRIKLLHGGVIIWDEEGKEPLHVKGAQPQHLYAVNAQQQRDSGILKTKFMSKDKGVVTTPSTRTNPDGTTRTLQNNWNIVEKFHPGLVQWRQDLREIRESEPLQNEPEARTNMRLFAESIPMQDDAAEEFGGGQRTLIGTTTHPGVNSEQLAESLLR